MKTILFATIILFMVCTLAYAGTVTATTGYGYVTDGNGKIIQKLRCPTGEVIVEDGTWVDVSAEDWASISVARYNADTLISWAMAQVFTAELIPHMAAFLDFANKANEVSKANFSAYATAVGLTETASAIINKAIELGAPITQGE